MLIRHSTVNKILNSASTEPVLQLHLYFNVIEFQELADILPSLILMEDININGRYQYLPLKVQKLGLGQPA